jgi:hypothetical protein
MKKATRSRGPSKRSLEEIPEIDFDRVRVRRNPWAGRIAAEGMVHPSRGRPRKGEETGPTVPRSIRFPTPVWKELERRARDEGLTLHSALRAAVLDWARRAR